MRCMIRVTAVRGGAATMPVVPRFPTPMGTLSNTISIVLPAKNEAQGLRRALPGLRAALLEAEVIVVDDGSTDETAQVAALLGAKVLTSPYPMGNGAAIKRGARAAQCDIIVFMDADR